MSKTIEQRAGTNDAEVAPNVYRFRTERINWYVVETDGELIVVDAGLPSHWQRLLNGLDGLEYGLGDISAVVLTHGHGDTLNSPNNSEKPPRLRYWCTRRTWGWSKAPSKEI